jgi:hypothetical protein
MPRVIDNKVTRVPLDMLDKLCRFALFGAVSYMEGARGLEELRERRLEFNGIKGFCRIDLLAHPEFNAVLARGDRAYERCRSTLARRGDGGGRGGGGLESFL